MLSSTAQAQIGEWIPNDFIPSGIFTVDEEREETYIDLGAAVVHRPAYLGSSEQDTSLFPFVNAEYKGRWFFNPYQGVGFNPVNTKKLKIATGVSYVSGRKLEDTSFADESFDVGGSAGLVANARYIFDLGAVEFTATQAVGGDVEGLQMSGRIATLIPITKQFRVAPALSLAWQDGARRNSFYGVTPEQAAIIGGESYDYGSDFTNAGATLGAYWRDQDRHWRILGLVQYRGLLGEVKDSPLTAKDDGFLAVVGFARRY